MTRPPPDTDPLKREPPGSVSKVPDNGRGDSGHPAGKPDEKGFPHTGDRHRPKMDETDPASTETPTEENHPKKREQ